MNVSGYFDPLFAFLDRAVDERFVKVEHRAMIIMAHSPADLLDRLQSYKPPQVEKWIDRTSS
jgi:predicted Rossmann-fold nucleotide-binding protein